MIGFTVALCAGLILYLKFSPKKSDGMERMFTEELQKIKKDSIINFIDQDFGRKNFELFKKTKFSASAQPANDEICVNYSITSLQDLVPQDLA